jgi:hypothetical protein
MRSCIAGSSIRDEGCGRFGLRSGVGSFFCGVYIDTSQTAIGAQITELIDCHDCSAGLIALLSQTTTIHIKFPTLPTPWTTNNPMHLGRKPVLKQRVVASSLKQDFTNTRKYQVHEIKFIETSIEVETISKRRQVIIFSLSSS